MSDIGLIWKDGYADIDLALADVVPENTLVTEVLVSLFSDKRYQSERGWWSRDMGSLLWLLEREKRTLTVLENAKLYCKDSLQWTIDKGICKSVTVNGKLINKTAIALEIILEKSDNNKYSYLWENVTNFKDNFNQDSYTILFLK